MSAFGVKSAYGDLLRVLMHRPGAELGVVTNHNLAEFNYDRPVHRGAFLSDYDAMLRLFREHGTEVLLLTEVLKDDSDSLVYMAHRPNMTYTRDLASVFRSGAVLMSPHLKGRWGDQMMMDRAFQRLGIPVLGAVEPPGFLEGGGVTLIGEETAVVSLCDRANEAGTRMLRDIILGRQVKSFLEVPLPYGYIHIDGIFMVLDEKLCLVFEEAFRSFPCRLYDADGRPRHIMFLDYLEEIGMRRIAITREERDAGHLNVVVTRRSRKAVGFAGADRVAAEMKKHGWQLDTFPAEELFQGNGGAHCMTCPILVS